MPTLSNILARDVSLTPAQSDWLHLLVGDWQIVADLAFSDLLLYVSTAHGVLCGAQIRPATASTLFERDVVGDPIDRMVADDFEATVQGKQILVTGDDEVEITLVPVSFKGVVIGVVAVYRAVIPDRVVSQAQENYDDILHLLLSMITTGEFPLEGTPTGFRHGTPRVTDGLIQMDEDGVVLYASPNAVSNYRRLGVEQALTGSVLAEVVTNTIEDHATVDESLPVVLMGRAAWVTEVESHGVAVSMRAVPLKSNGQRGGAIVMCRDVTELRRRERELMTKDATIREINHRVKNNLQTVSALLRLQARRATNDETRSALENAQRRVSTIAVVHERLSESIDEVVEFDTLFGPLLRMVRDVAVTDAPVASEFRGSFGVVRAEQATALAVVLNELISNAIEHGLVNGGTLVVSADRDGQFLRVELSDDGVGMGPDGPGSGLGTQIVRTMVQGELHGKIDWSAGEEEGTKVVMEILLAH